MAATTGHGSGLVIVNGHEALGALRRVAAYAAVVAVTGGCVVTGYGVLAGAGTGVPHPAAANVTPAAAGSATGSARTAPSATEFAAVLVGVTNAHAAASGDPTRITAADCVRPSAGRYMCSFSSRIPGGARTCHVMQARWTPNGASSFSVTLAGRALRCGSLREALRSLS